MTVINGWPEVQLLCLISFFGSFFRCSALASSSTFGEMQEKKNHFGLVSNFTEASSIHSCTPALSSLEAWRIWPCSLSGINQFYQTIPKLLNFSIYMVWNWPGFPFLWKLYLIFCYNLKKPLITNSFFFLANKHTKHVDYT